MFRLSPISLHISRSRHHRTRPSPTSRKACHGSRRDAAPTAVVASAIPRRATRRSGRHVYDFNVWTTKKRVEKLRYMHRNPLKRGLVDSPEQWRWSSYRFYLLGETGAVQVNVGWTAISFRGRIA